jgi:SAM-dependent methyltransferase
LLASAIAHGQSDASDQEWSRFMTWMKAQRPDAFGHAMQWVSAYRDKLVADGLSPAEADAIAGRLKDRVLYSAEGNAVNFNRIYSIPNLPPSTVDIPNPFLAETISALKAGSALDIGMGKGRNTIYLAQRGWNATGLDVSDVGVAYARERARKLGVQIDARVQDINSFDLGSSQWDLVCLLYTPLNKGQEPLCHRIATGLKAGGYMIAEGFGSPVMETLMEAWAMWKPTNLHLVRLEYREGPSDWGGNEVGHLLLRKPA